MFLRVTLPTGLLTGVSPPTAPPSLYAVHNPATPETSLPLGPTTPPSSALASGGLGFRGTVPLTEVTLAAVLAFRAIPLRAVLIDAIEAVLDKRGVCPLGSVTTLVDEFQAGRGMLTLPTILSFGLKGLVV
jgi:hypothetical protein